MALMLAASLWAPLRAQSGIQEPDHQHMQMPMNMKMEPDGWQFMQDGVLFGMFNHQGGPRGGDQFKAPNWWMGMLTRRIGSSQFTFNTMLSLDPATVGSRTVGRRRVGLQRPRTR